MGVVVSITGRQQTASTLPKVDAGKRLVHLERAWALACLGVDMIPVVQAKRHVAVLLDLEHHDVAAQRVKPFQPAGRRRPQTSE